jgi:hypothetical protein
MEFQSGLSALVRLAAALELDRENAGAVLVTLSIGGGVSSADDSPGDYAWEAAGAHLCYVVSIHGGEVRTAASLVDSVSQAQPLLRAPDTEQGWELTFRFISSLEKYQVHDLTKPIVVGNPAYDDPTTCWIIA